MQDLALIDRVTLQHPVMRYQMTYSIVQINCVNCRLYCILHDDNSCFRMPIVVEIAFRNSENPSISNLECSKLA